MSNYAKIDSFVIGPDEGTSYWQPKPSTGYATVKLSPYNSPYDGFSAGIQVLDPGSSVREHAHERGHEMLFVYEGTGHCVVDSKTHDLEPGTMLVVGRGTLHLLANDGDTQMKIMWMMFPPGLEDWFRAIGQPREPGETEAPVFDRPEDVATILAQQRFVKHDNPRN